jgi:hypothetical protein
VFYETKQPTAKKLISISQIPDHRAEENFDTSPREAGCSASTLLGPSASTDGHTDFSRSARKGLFTVIWYVQELPGGPTEHLNRGERTS